MVYPITAHCMDHQHDEDGGFVIEATTIQDPIAFATTLARRARAALGRSGSSRRCAAFRRWVGVLAMANDENNAAVALDEDGGERFEVDFQPARARADRARASSSAATSSRPPGAHAGLLDRARVDARPGHAAGWATTRRRSVVDRNGESHDVKRLFVGDGSLVPRTLSVNPSLTIMALATQARRPPRRRSERLPRAPGSERAHEGRAARASTTGRSSSSSAPSPSRPAPRDVVVRIGGAGRLRDRPARDRRADGAGRASRLPLVLGHENAGWVHAVGDGVTAAAVGDAVLVYPPYSCGLCVAVPARPRHALRASRVHRPHARRRLRRVRARRRALARPAAGRRRAGRRRAARRRRASPPTTRSSGSCRGSSRARRRR